MDKKVCQQHWNWSYSLYWYECLWNSSTKSFPKTLSISSIADFTSKSPDYVLSKAGLFSTQPKRMCTPFVWIGAILIKYQPLREVSDGKSPSFLPRCARWGIPLIGALLFMTLTLHGFNCKTTITITCCWTIYSVMLGYRTMWAMPTCSLYSEIAALDIKYVVQPRLCSTCYTS